MLEIDTLNLHHRKQASNQQNKRQTLIIPTLTQEISPHTTYFPILDKITEHSINFYSKVGKLKRKVKVERGECGDEEWKLRDGVQPLLLLLSVNYYCRKHAFCLSLCCKLAMLNTMASKGLKPTSSLSDCDLYGIKMVMSNGPT